MTETLADFYNPGEYLEEGVHVVAIREHRIFQYNSGNWGVEFQLSDGEGKKTKVSFPLVKTALWNLAGFVFACGLTTEQMRAFDVNDQHSQLLFFKALYGKQVQLRVVKAGQYHEVEEQSWVKVGEPAKAEHTPREKPAEGAQGDAKPDNLPF